MTAATAPAATAVRPATVTLPFNVAEPITPPAYDYLVLRVHPDTVARLEHIHAQGQTRGVRLEYNVSFSEWCAGLLKDAAYADMDYAELSTWKEK